MMAKLTAIKIHELADQANDQYWEAAKKHGTHPSIVDRNAELFGAIILTLQDRLAAAELDRDRYKAALEMITQIISGNCRTHGKIAKAALKGADVRNLE